MPACRESDTQLWGLAVKRKYGVAYRSDRHIIQYSLGKTLKKVTRETKPLKAAERVYTWLLVVTLFTTGES